MDKYENIMYLKVFTDKNRKMYWFNVPEYIKIMEKNGYTSGNIILKLETLMEDTKLIKSERTINRVREYAEGYVGAGGKMPNISIEVLKQVGLALKGDEFGLLVEICKR